jgi:hypothetical protein
MSHEERAYPRCGGAGSYPVCGRPDTMPVMAGGSDCSGRGFTWAFVYERVAPNLQGHEEAEVLWQWWHGPTRERKAAHKELAKRNGEGR